ncbi:DNA-binding protein P3A2 [Portunus trituberculatus]|uniref:DNA-binding protein P3A2 n=1 Tax=Portunus trituberculatus TaxID=210409 RepID=A0A5B7J1W4_PORTR|nr:DNA-binding protein P3A2 [Portunus trituberculatus]
MKTLRQMLMTELENALAQQAPPPPQDDPSLHELPPLIIDGIPTPVEKMTQAQLRAFIPLMLKYSTGRGKPGWGKESTRPPWWPKDVPWANVRMDARSEDQKHKVGLVCWDLHCWELFYWKVLNFSWFSFKFLVLQYRKRFLICTFLEFFGSTVQGEVLNYFSVILWFSSAGRGV